MALTEAQYIKMTREILEQLLPQFVKYEVERQLYLQLKRLREDFMRDLGYEVREQIKEIIRDKVMIDIHIKDINNDE